MLVVLNVILSSVRQKMLVIYKVSLPTDEKLVHFCVERVGRPVSLGCGQGVCVCLSERSYCVERYG